MMLVLLLQLVLLHLVSVLLFMANFSRVTPDSLGSSKVGVGHVLPVAIY